MAERHARWIRAGMKITKWLRATTALLVLVALFTPFSATYLWLHIQKRLVKKEVKAKLIAGIDKSELVHFTFSQSQIETDLRWEHSKEFEYKGEMYDIVETQIIGDSIHYVCWHDRAETKLNRRLQALIAQATSGTPEHHTREGLCYQLLKLLVIEPLPELQLIASESTCEFVEMCIHYDALMLQHTKKPPRRIPFTPNPTI
ncbi:MAG: hypothetical protein SNJ55_08730 [Chloroherpetonaceae bacterium]